MSLRAIKWRSNPCFKIASSLLTPRNDTFGVGTTFAPGIRPANACAIISFCKVSLRGAIGDEAIFFEIASRHASLAAKGSLARNDTESESTGELPRGGVTVGEGVGVGAGVVGLGLG